MWGKLALGMAAVALAGCAAAPRQEAAADEAGPVRVASAGFPYVAAKRPPGAPKLANDREQGPPNAKYNLETEADEHGPPTVAQLLRAHAQRDAIVRSAGEHKMAGLLPSQWQPLGPSNVGGRLRALAFDPSNPSRLFAGSATGGLWISDDAGVTWRASFDFLPNLSITSIVFDPKNPATVYIGTGEATQGFVGVGVFKSTDGGATFHFLDATNPDANPDWRFVNRLAIDPADPRVLLAGMTNNNFTTGAIYRSADGGSTWTKASTVKALDVDFSPTDPTHAVAGLDDGTIAFSADGGISWQRTATLVPTPSGSGGTARAEIAFAPTQPGVVYASVDNNRGEVWRSTDFGATWVQAATPGHLNKQGDYDNAIWVDPTDANHVVVAGLDIYQSRDGGQNFVAVSDSTNWPASPHSDHHQLVSPPNFAAGNTALFDGSDGGLYRADNVYALGAGNVGVGWTNMNQGLMVTQFYSGAGTNANGGRVTGGTQDNGSLVLRDGGWRRFFGGDGGFVAVDPAADVLYGEYVNLAIHRSQGGLPGRFICSGIADALGDDGNTTFCGKGATGKANFIAPFMLDPNNSGRMLAGGSSLWVTDNVRAVNPAWHAIKPPSSIAGNFINAIAVQEGNGNGVWVGHNDGELFHSVDALSPAPTWTPVAGLPARRVMRILTDPADQNHVIVALTGFVPDNLWQTRDGGATWSSITANLPFAPVFDVKRNPGNASWLYVATSVGIFTSEDGGASWSTSNEGPANIRVRELFWIDNATLGAATFGRGMYKAALAAPNVANYQDLWWAGSQENGWGMSIAQHGSTLFSAMFVYDDAGQPVWYVMPGGSWNAANTAYTGALFQPTGSSFANYDVSGFNAGPAVGNATITFTNATTATLTYTINGKSATKSIQRQLFGPPDATPGGSYGDLWWGGAAQNGWGIAINQQYRTLFCVWYTYDANGRTIWYVIPGGKWSAANVFTGTAFRTTGSAWLGKPYDPGLFTTHAVGSVTLTFRDASNAVMAYTVNGVSGSKPLTRQPFP